MRRQYSVKRGVRPRDIRRSGHGAAASARLFMCAECRAQALICSCCDRGQIYCAGDCAARARRRTRRDAGRRYQTSRRGRLAHAERSRRYRVRCKNVTHHGSPPSPPDDLLSSGSPAIASDASAFVVRARRPYRAVIGAGGAVRISSVKGSCVAAAVAGGRHDTTGWDAAMVTPPDIEARILRLYHAEKWLIGTIAQQLHVHYSVVGRVLAQAGLPRPGPPPRKSRIDPYLAFIRQTLETFPALTASRLYVMVRERGYRGSPDHFRHLIACHRPRPKAEAYLRLRSLARRAGAGRLGTFRPSRDRPRAASTDGVRHGAQPLAPDLPALLPGRQDGELPAWPRRRLYRVEWCSSCPALRQSEERGAGTSWRRNPLPSRHCWVLLGIIVTNLGPSRSGAAMRKAAWKEPSDTYVTHSSPREASPVSTISTPRPMPGAMARPPTGAVRTNPSAPSAKCSPTKRLACLPCRTTRRRCWSASRSRSARRPMSASTSTIIRSRTRMSGAFLLCSLTP